MMTKSRLRWAEYAEHMEEPSMYKILVGKPGGKRLLRRPRCRWEDIKINFRERGCRLDSSGSG
jgi:hypothetical protein